MPKERVRSEAQSVNQELHAIEHEVFAVTEFGSSGFRLVHHHDIKEGVLRRKRGTRREDPAACQYWPEMGCNQGSRITYNCCSFESLINTLPPAGFSPAHRIGDVFVLPTARITFPGDLLYNETGWYFVVPEKSIS